MMRRVQTVVLFAVFACLSSAAHATTEDTRAKTRSDPEIVTPEAAKAQLYSGGVGYTYKIDLPPAAGITPDLQLSYSSLTGITEYGKGWSLNLSKIERSTRFRTPCYEDAACINKFGVDTFEIDGSLLIADPDPNHPDRFHLEQVDHRRILYNPTDDSWEVTNPDGTKHLYGFRAAANSKLRTDGRTDLPTVETFRWSLDKVIDPRGNYYEVNYAYETFSHPQPDGSPVTYNMNNHPDQIRYTYHPAPEASNRITRLVTFEWEDRGEEDWNDDRPTSYRSGFKIQISERLSNIYVGTDSNNSGVIDPGERIRRYEFGYATKPTEDPDTQTNPVFSQLIWVQRYGKTDADMFPAKTDFSYRPITRGFANSETVSLVQQVGGGNAGIVATRIIDESGNHPWVDYFPPDRIHASRTVSTLADLNGDGFADYIYLTGGTWEADDWPCGFNPPACVGIEPGGHEWWIRYGPLTEDTPAERWRWKFLNGIERNFGSDLISGTASGMDQLGTHMDLIDMNGDGLLDYVSGTSPVTSAEVFLNLGDSACLNDEDESVGCFSEALWPGKPFDIELTTTACTELAQCFDGVGFIGATLADVNGDGLPDEVYGYRLSDPGENRDWVTVRFNNGSGFDLPITVPMTDWSLQGQPDLQLGSIDNIGGYSTISRMFADINGDGLADVGALDTCLGGSVHAFSLGSGWQSRSGTGQWAVDESGYDNSPGDFCVEIASAKTLRPQLSSNVWGMVGTLVDLNGDGILDIYHFDANGVDTLPLPGVYFGLGDGSYLTVNNVIPVDEFSHNVPLGIDWPMPNAWSGGPGNASMKLFSGQLTEPKGKLLQAEREHADINGDGLTDLIDRNTVYLNESYSGLLETITNELGGVTQLEYQPSSWFNDTAPVATTAGEGGYEVAEEGYALVLPDSMRTSSPQWVLTNITVEDGRGGANQSQSIAYSDLLYDSDSRQYIGARMAESTDAASVLTRSFFHQTDGLRPRLEFEETLLGNVIRTEKTEWSAVPAVNESGNTIPDAWFPKPLKTITTLIEPGNLSVTASRIVSRIFDDKTGNLILENDWGADGIKNTADDFKKTFLYQTSTTNPDFTDWLISYPFATLEGGLGGPAVGFYYDHNINNYDPPTQGLVTKRFSTQTRLSEHDTSATIIEQWFYDAFGNQTQYLDGRAVAAGGTPVTRTTQYYPDFDVFPSKITNALLHVTEFAFDTDFGEVSKILDPNSYLQCWEYDAFGRLINIKERTNAANITRRCLKMLTDFEFNGFGDPSFPQHILATRYPDSSTPGIRSRSYIDGLGRVYQEEEERKVDKFAVTVRSWGNRGELACEALPELVFGGGGMLLPECGSVSQPGLGTTYDALLRPLVTNRITNGNPVPEIVRSYDIGVLDLKTGNELVQTRTVFAGAYPWDRIVRTGTDPSGRVVAIDETGGGLTLLERDPRGRIVVVDGPDVNADLNRLSITYNDQDQRMSLSGWWGAGNWSYDYDTNGNLIAQISPASTEIQFHWDKLNRLGVKDYDPFNGINDPGSQDIVYTYDDESTDGIGRLHTVSTPGGLTAVDTTYGYKWNGALQTKVRDFAASGAFQFTYLSDALGRRKSAFLPNGTVIKYQYNGSVLEQILSGTTVVADNIKLHASGAIEEIGYPLISAGSGASYTYELDTYRLDTAIGRGAIGPNVQDLNFDYDLAGNLTTVIDGVDQFDQTFTYDALHRILRADSTGPPEAYGTLDFGYDFAGNLRTKGPLALDYASTNGGPHAVSSVEVAGFEVGSFVYNNQGGVKSRVKNGVTQTITRDDDGRVTSVTDDGGSGAAYVYDESGQRSQKTVHGGGSDVLYVDPEYEVDLVANEHKVHYFHGSRRIATENRSGKGTPQEPGATVSWQYHFPDFVGSNSVVVNKDIAGLVTTQKSYFTPFGEFAQDGSGLSDYLFTDQENDPESGFMYYGARYYDPWVGRFLSQDPELVGAFGGVTFGRLGSDPQQFNAYSYARNTPTRYTDPTGAALIEPTQTGYVIHYTGASAKAAGITHVGGKPIGGNSGSSNGNGGGRESAGKIAPGASEGGLDVVTGEVSKSEPLIAYTGADSPGVIFSASTPSVDAPEIPLTTTLLVSVQEGKFVNGNLVFDLPGARSSGGTFDIPSGGTTEKFIRTHQRDGVDTVRLSVQLVVGPNATVTLRAPSISRNPPTTPRARELDI